MALLSVQNLQKTYNKNQVVKDISLNVSSGEIIGLLGPNGAGKTTSFYMIVGLLAADHGQIKIDQKDLTKMPIHLRSRLGISYLPQEPSIFRKLNVSQNILSVLELNEKSKLKQQEKLDSLLNELNIEHIRKSMAISLSGGERRRVEIARCLATNPKFILLDEPFAGIDPIAVLDIQTIIMQLSQKGIGVLITDHNVRETLGICNKAYIVNQGKVFASGSPNELIENENVREIYLGKNFKI
jgi:lipopolysaccharide export system ATP-binding protein